MVPTTIVRFKCSSVLQGCSCWLLLSSLESFYHSTPFDEAAVPGRRGRTAGPTGGNEAYFWTSTGLPSFLLSSAASQIPSVLQEQRLPTAYDDSRSPDAPSMAGGDEHGHREEGDESSLLEDSVAAASDSDAWGRQVGDSVASETTESYLGEEGEGFLLSASPLSKSHSPERRSRNHKRESKMRISKILMSVLTATTLLAALLVYRKSKQPREDPSGRKSSFSTWIVESGMSEKRRVGAIVLAGVIVIVAALLTIGFAGTEGPDVRAEGQITSSEAEGAPAPSDSSVSSTRQLVEIEKRVREVVSDAPMRAVAVAFAVLTLPFLVMRPSQVRDQTEDVGEADLKQRNGEAESADEGKRQEVFEEADGGETIAKGQEGATSGADAGVVEGEKEKETEAKGEEVDEGGVAEERRERPQMEAGRESYEAKTIEGEAKTQADQADMLKNPDVLSKTQGEEDPRTDKALGQEAQKALSSFVPDEVPSVFDYGPVFQAITNDIAAQAKSGKHQRRDKSRLSDYPAETEARRQVGKLKSAVAHILPELNAELDRQLGVLEEPWEAVEDLRERLANFTLLSRMVQVAVVQNNLSRLEEGLLQRRFDGQFVEFARHVGGQEAIVRHIRAALADDGFGAQEDQRRSSENAISVVLEKITRVLEKKAEILLDAVDFSGGVRRDYNEEFSRTLQVVNNAVSRAHKKLSELHTTTL